MGDENRRIAVATGSDFFNGLVGGKGRIWAAPERWGKDRDDEQVLDTVQGLVADFAKDDPSSEADVESLGRDALKLICLEYVTN